MFVNEKILEEYSVKIYKIDPYFYEHYGKKYKLMKMGLYLYISFRIDVYFTEYLLVVEVDEKGHTDRDLIFEEKRQKHQRKNLVVNSLELIRVKNAITQTMKPAEYKNLLVTLKTELKKLEKESNKKIKELKDENKESKDENKEIKDEINKLKDKIKKLTNQSV